MAQARCGSMHHVQQEAATAGKHGVAAVVAMLQSERSLPRTGGDGLDEVDCASTGHLQSAHSDQAASKRVYPQGQDTPAARSNRDLKRNASRDLDYMTAPVSHFPEGTNGGATGHQHRSNAMRIDGSQVSLPCTVGAQRKNADHYNRMVGDVIIAELSLEGLQSKRRRLVELSIEVLEARCPGFCARASMSEDEYLREASCALADISLDVDEAAHALEIVRRRRDTAPRPREGLGQPSK